MGRCTNAATASTRRASADHFSAHRWPALESLSLHESQSRLWENMVGRSRAFCTALAPAVSEASDGRDRPG